MRYTLIVVKCRFSSVSLWGTGRERAGDCGEFHLNCSRTCAELCRRDEFRRGEFQFQLSPVYAEREIALQQLGISCRFVLGNRAVAVTVDLGENLFGDSDAGRKVDLQPDATRFDGHKRRLQILVITMGENAGWKRKQREQQRQTIERPAHGFRHFTP